MKLLISLQRMSFQKSKANVLKSLSNVSTKEEVSVALIGPVGVWKSGNNVMIPILIK